MKNEDICLSGCKTYEKSASVYAHRLYVVSMTRQADTFSVNILKRDRKLLSKHENKFKTDEEERRKTKGVTTKQKGIAELFQ